ncbi:MAG: TonB-dependent receptor [Pseudomonadota bacterium]
MSYRSRSLVARAVAISIAAPLFLSQAAAEEKTDEILPEVVVTAQFVETNVQDTPIAITAVTAEMLEARSQVSVEQVTNQAPNVTLKAQGASNGPSLIGFIRGIGQTDFNPALEPGVGLYVDDVYYSTLTGSVLDLLDLSRLEVLRGPQGTLAGKNSIGGSIKLYSKKPGEGGHGFLETGYGDLNAISVRGASDFTLSPDKLYARVAGVSRSRDGHVTRLDYGCTHPGSGVPVYAVRGGTCVLGHEGGIKYVAGRFSLRWLASDAVEVNLAADITSDHSEVPGNILRNVGPTLLAVGIDTDNNAATGYLANVGTIVPIPAPTGYDLLWTAPGAAGACRFIAYGSASCDPNSPNNPYVNYSTYLDPRAVNSGGPTASGWTPVSVPDKQTLKAYGVSANIDWKISDNLQLQSITAWREYNSSFGDDADGTPMPVQMLLQHIFHRQKSQELRLNGKVSEVVDWTVGAFYFDQDTNEDGRIDLPYAALDFLHGPDLVPAKTKALFAHGIFHLGMSTDLALGVRRTDEDKTYTYARHNPDGTTIPAPCSPPSYNCALTGLNGLKGQFSDKRMDYRVALQHKWTDDVMTYVQYTTGYKGGGINPRPFNPNQVLAFGPETLKAYEAGVKSELLDNKLRLNAAVFYNNYKDIQLALNDCTVFAGAGFGVPCILPANVGDAHIKGVELEFNWYPVAGLELDGSISKLDFNYTRVDAATGVPANGISPYTPKTKWSLGMQYAFNLAGGGSITPRLDASYQGDIYGNPLNSATSKMEGYTLLNGRLTWRSAEDAWNTSLEVQNLTDKLYFHTTIDLLAAAGGYQSAQPALPRTWMLTIKRNF